MKTECTKCSGSGLVNEPGKPEKHDCAYCDGTGFVESPTLTGGVEEEAKELWRMAMTYATNLCVELSNDFNNDDEIEEATIANRCANLVKGHLNDPHPDFVAAYAGARSQQQSIPLSIVEQLEQSNPYGVDKNLRSNDPELHSVHAWNKCVFKLRSLLKDQQPAVQDVGVLVGALQMLVKLKDMKEEPGFESDFGKKTYYQTTKPMAWQRAKEVLSKYNTSKQNYIQDEKPLAELSDEHAVEIYNLSGMASISDQAKAHQVKDILATNKFYNTQTNIPGRTWHKIFEYLKLKGYTIP